MREEDKVYPPRPAHGMDVSGMIILLALLVTEMFIFSIIGWAVALTIVAGAAIGLAIAFLIVAALVEGLLYRLQMDKKVIGIFLDITSRASALVGIGTSLALVSRAAGQGYLSWIDGPAWLAAIFTPGLIALTAIGAFGVWLYHKCEAEAPES